jgi:hypothetical protein
MGKHLRIPSGPSVGAAALIGLALVVGVLRTCGWTEPLVLPDPAQAVRDSARAAWVADSARWQVVVHELTMQYATATRERDSLKALRRSRPVRVVHVPTPGTPGPDAGAAPDSIPMVRLADYRALERENALADSIIVAQADRIRADSAAYARLAALQAFTDSTHSAAYTKLARDLARARRGPRFLGLPVPQLGAGYCATLAAGVVRAGPCVGLTFEVKL